MTVSVRDIICKHCGAFRDPILTKPCPLCGSRKYPLLGYNYAHEAKSFGCLLAIIGTLLLIAIAAGITFLLIYFYFH
jgi:hypothetical protein